MEYRRKTNSTLKVLRPSRQLRHNPVGVECLDYIQPRVGNPLTREANPGLKGKIPLGYKDSNVTLRTRMTGVLLHFRAAVVELTNGVAEISLVLHIQIIRGRRIECLFAVCDFRDKPGEQLRRCPALVER